MATFYLDYEGGSDAADGTTFANRWKTFASGATAARTAPGDTIRVMGSPAPTSLGINGTWTDCPNYGTGVTVAISSSTNASPIVVTSATHGLSTGDYVFITGHTTNTSGNGLWKVTVTSGTVFSLDGSTGNGVGGASGTIQKYTNTVVQLASAVTKTIASTGNRGEGRTAWTASANVTCTLATTTLLKSGDVSDSISIASGFTTGLAAYKALGSAVDFSGYKQVSFTIYQSSGTIGAAASVSLKLCSDTVGATPVNTIDIPNLVIAGLTNKVTVDLGSALGSSIQSIGLYVNTDNGAQVFLIDNIIACKDSTSADSLSLSSLIGKNSGNETYFAVGAIKDTAVFLDNGSNALNSAWTGYSGTTETVTTYKREPIVLPSLAAVSTVSALGLIQEGGSSGSLISYEGGWDRTAMTTQNIETWFVAMNGCGIGLHTNSKSFISFNKINFCRFATGMNISGTSDSTFNNLHCNNCAAASGTGIIMTSVSSRNTIPTLYSASNCSSVGVQTDTACNSNEFTTVYGVNNNTGVGINITGAYNHLGAISSVSNNGTNIALTGFNLRVDSITNCKNSTSTGNTAISCVGQGNVIYSAGTVSNSRAYGLNLGGSSRIYNATVSGSATAGCNSAGFGFLRNCSFSETTEFATLATTSQGSYIYSEKHDQTANNHYIYTNTGVITSDASVRHTASGISWKMSPTSSDISSYSPLKLSIAKIACTANNLVTVKAWMQRDSTSLTMALHAPGGQLAGVATDVSASMTAAINTWEELTITFTPTEAGVIEIFALAYGGTSLNGYVDDMTITQA